MFNISLESRSPGSRSKLKKTQGKPGKKEEGSTTSNSVPRKSTKQTKKEFKESSDKDLTDDEEIVVNKDEREALKQIENFLKKANLPLSPFPVTKGRVNNTQLFQE